MAQPILEAIGTTQPRLRCPKDGGLLQEAQTAQIKNLGTWHDVLVCPKCDMAYREKVTA